MSEPERLWECAKCGGKTGTPPSHCCGAGVFDPDRPPKEPNTLEVPWLWVPRGSRPADIRGVKGP